MIELYMGALDLLDTATGFIKHIPLIGSLLDKFFPVAQDLVVLNGIYQNIIKYNGELKNDDKIALADVSAHMLRYALLLSSVSLSIEVTAIATIVCACACADVMADAATILIGESELSQKYASYQNDINQAMIDRIKNFPGENGKNLNDEIANTYPELLGCYCMLSLFKSIDKSLVNEVGWDFIFGAGNDVPQRLSSLTKKLADLAGISIGIPSDINDYKNVLSDANWQSLIGKGITFKPVNGSDVAPSALGENGIAYRYALMNLNSFVALGVDYSTLNKNNDLDLYDAQTGKGNLSEQWINDRSRYLNYYLTAHTGSVTPSNPTGYPVNQNTLSWSDPTSQENYYIQDIQNNLSIVVTGTKYSSYLSDPSAYSTHTIIFGSNQSDIIQGSLSNDHIYGGTGDDVINGNAGNDYLEGNAGVDFLNGGENNDILIGGAGDDTLNGDAGNDYLEGGLGIDTYRIVSGEGTDTILDADGFGYIQWDNVILSGSSGLAADKWKHPGDGVWQDLTNNISYILSLQADGKNQLIIFKGSEKLIVNDWKAGDLNISGLVGNTDAADIPDTSGGSDITTNTVYIDTEHTYYSTYFGSNTSNAGTSQNDYIIGTANREVILVANEISGNDIIDAGAGDDAIIAGNGKNTLLGGEGSDIISGGNDKDIIFGDQRVGDIAAYIETSRSAVSVDGKGDFLAGLDGDDVLISGAKSDTIEGGDGSDLIISGAGDDFISSDGSWFVSTIDPYYWTLDTTPGQPSNYNLHKCW